MKLFYQLSSEEQDRAIEHCADLITSNAIDNGLHIETPDDADGVALKERLDELFKSLHNAKDLHSTEEKLKFLMSNDTFSETVFELASEMACNAYYHESNELTIFIDSLHESSEEDSNIKVSYNDEDEGEDDNDYEESDYDDGESAEEIEKKRKLLN